MAARERGGAADGARPVVGHLGPLGAVLLAAVAVHGNGQGADAAGEVRVIVHVTVPASTPQGDVIWVSGNAPSLGGWNGAGLRLKPAGNRVHVAEIVLERGQAIEFKVTRGSWDTVEKNADGGEIPNRRWTPGTHDTLHLTVEAWRDQTEDRSHRVSTLSGDVRVHARFESSHVRPRDVLVYLPPGYDAQPDRRYPVLYFHDGNNVFDAATSFLGVEWGVDETAERLIRGGTLQPFIAVAVANTPDRITDYTPVRDAGRGDGGGAGAYARFLIGELKPFVDGTYRTLKGPEHTGVIGSSLGGLVSLYLGLEHPGVYGMVGCLSPAAGWGGGDLIRRAAAGQGGSVRVWVDMGTREAFGAQSTERVLGGARRLRDALVSAGWRAGRDLHYEEVEGAGHDERAWAARVDRVLVFLLKRTDD